MASILRLAPRGCPVHAWCALPVFALACTAEVPVRTRDDSAQVGPDGAVQGDAGTRWDDAGAPMLPVPRPGGAFVHLFEWRYPDIAAECERTLGPAGFDAVQISPPNEHLVLRAAGFPWWQRYQPVSYSLDESRSGSKRELAEMVARCARAGVAVYVDAVLNHMSARPGGVGSHGTRFTKYGYPGLYGAADFHQPPCSIADADYAADADRVQRCELLGLADLDTGSSAVRARLTDYLVSLIELGVRGFRLDAAKHIAPRELEEIVRAVRERVGDARAPWYFAEVFTYGGEAVTAQPYLALDPEGASAVTEFRFTRLGDHFRPGASRALDLRDFFGSLSDLVPSERAVVFVDNHDTQRQGGLSYHDGAAYELAMITALAAPYGTVSVMSSYAFDRTAGLDRGPPSDANGHTDPLYLAGHAEPRCSHERVPAPGAWVCEHRRPYVAGLVALRRAAQDAPLAALWSDDHGGFSFARDGRAFVAINRGDGALTRSFHTTLPPGAYCDVVAGLPGLEGCAAGVVTVAANGDATLTVPPESAVALYVGASP